MRADPKPAVHALLRIAPAAALSWDDPAPQWASESLQRAPWVVVRRAAARADDLPVGVRGSTRAQRAAAWLPIACADRAETPQSLALARRWRGMRDAPPAIGALAQVESILDTHGWAGRWGPGGSAGFELASGRRTTHADSDLDLVLYADRRCERAEAKILLAALNAMPVRCDALLETPLGGVSLSDYARDQDTVLLRTQSGPQLVQDPWPADDAMARTA